MSSTSDEMVKDVGLDKDRYVINGSVFVLGTVVKYTFMRN